MTTLTTPQPDLLRAAHYPSTGNYLTHRKGPLSWLITLDHKRIGIMYMIGVCFALFLGGLFALLLRTELINPTPTFMSDANASFNFYNHMFTLHGAVMVFMFIIPAVPAILGNFALPIMLGAKDVAFPRLNLLSFYLYALGGLFFVWVLLAGVLNAAFDWSLAGGLDTGWTFYTPFSTGESTKSAVIPATMGAFILGFSSILTGVNFVVSIHTLRPKGMTWFRMPLFLWALYGTSIIQILATPVLGITLLLLIAERSLGVGIFDPALGGDPVLYQHFFWFYSHPAVYIMILPAMGIMSELISVFSRKHIFGYKFIANSSIAIALLGFLVWGHHMFVSGQSSLASAAFSLLTFAVAIPSAIKVFNWLATMYKGNIQLKTPMIYAMFFVLLFTVGGLTGLFLGALAVNVPVHDTYFVVAHFHYVMVGSMMMAFLGGMYYWWPKMFGRMYSEKWSIISSIVVFIGFNMTFFIQFIAGTQGMPRRYASYPDNYTTYHQVSTVGAYVLGVGMFMVLGNWIHSLRKGRRAPANPWGANTLEWHCSSPPPLENFARTPVADDPYNFKHWHWDETIGGYIHDGKIDPPRKGSGH
ncbi:MAG: cbb3-type cytochrome c oxidase subunit I [Phycisphaeraceae bacterium]